MDRKEWEESTGNLQRHVKQCEPTDDPEVQLIEQYASGATYSYHRLRFLLAMWSARRHRPFSVVEDPEFCVIVKMLYSRAEIPSRVTVSRDVSDIFNESKKRVIAMLKVLHLLFHSTGH